MRSDVLAACAREGPVSVFGRGKMRNGGRERGQRRAKGRRMVLRAYSCVGE